MGGDKYSTDELLSFEYLYVGEFVENRVFMKF